MKIFMYVQENDINMTLNLQTIISESVDKAIKSLLLRETSVDNVNSSFDEWKSIFDKYLKQEIDELQENYLTKLNLKIHISPNYEFKGRKARWLAVYQKSTREVITSRTIPIAVNYALMYKEMKKRGIEKDDFNIEAQARITIGHEIGHGLVDYIKTTCRNTNNNKTTPNLNKIINSNPRQEEEMVEEFGETQFPQATYTYGSTLEEGLEELTTINKRQ